MEAMSLNGVVQAEYVYNAYGQQAVRTLTQSGQVIHSIFGPDGNRIAEYDEATGDLLRQYVWLGLTPVAVIEGGQVYFVRIDFIGRPVLATTAAGSVAWTAKYLPFGGAETSTGDLIALRFPGQWFQSESGLHQNWMRDYDPTTGRYIQADPLGLVDGASVYVYVDGKPTRLTDPVGLCPLCLAPALGGGVGLGDIAAGIAGAIIGTIIGSTVETGNADGPAPYDHEDEDDALDFPTYPGGGPPDSYCENLKHAIWVLRAMLVWRNWDLNPTSSTYRGHLARIAIISKKLEQLEEAYRIYCGGDCPPEEF